MNKKNRTRRVLRRLNSKALEQVAGGFRRNGGAWFAADLTASCTCNSLSPSAQTSAIDA